MTDGERAVFRELAFEVAEIVVKRYDQHISDKLKLHVAQCPVKAEVASFREQARGGKKAIGWLWAGICGVAGAGGFTALWHWMRGG